MIPWFIYTLVSVFSFTFSTRCDGVVFSRRFKYILLHLYRNTMIDIHFFFKCNQISITKNRRCGIPAAKKNLTILQTLEDKTVNIHTSSLLITKQRTFIKKLYPRAHHFFKNYNNCYHLTIYIFFVWASTRM